jgi:type II secretory pathway component PulM
LVPPSASIQLRLDGRGGAQVDAMQVAGRPLIEWLQEQRARQP